MAEKAGRKPGTFEKGDKRINRTIPGPGRPKDEFKQRMRALASDEKVEQELIAILSDADHPQFLKALAYATEHGYGRATEHVQHEGTITQFVVEAPAKHTDRLTWQRQYSHN